MWKYMNQCQKTVLFSPRSGTAKEVLLAFFHFFPSKEKLKKKKNFIKDLKIFIQTILRILKSEKIHKKIKVIKFRNVFI